MKITVNRSEFADALNSAARCLEKRSTIPILSMFRLDLEAGLLTVTATDIDQSLRIEIPATYKGNDGESACVDGKSLSAIVSKLSGDSVTFSLTNEHLIIERPSGDIKLRTRGAEDYPNLSFGKDYKLSFEAAELLDVCRSIVLGTSEDRFSAPHTAFHNVALFSVERNLVEGKFRCSASDGHRLAFINGLCDTDIKDPFDIQVPLMAVRMLLTGLKGSKHPVRVGEDDNFVFFAVGETRDFSFRKITIKYPDISLYRDRMNFDRVVKVEASEFRDSLELVAQILGPHRRGVRFALNGDLTLSAESSEVGEIKESIETDISFEEFETGFNVDYLLPIVRQMDGTIDICFARSPHMHKADDGTMHESGKVDWPIRITKTQNNVTSSFDIQSLQIS